MLHRKVPPVHLSFTFRLNHNSTIFGRYMSLQRQRRNIRMMILSDTHGKDLEIIPASLPRADVVLHCGDLTNDSQPVELDRTLSMLRQKSYSLIDLYCYLNNASL